MRGRLKDWNNSSFITKHYKRGKPGYAYLVTTVAYTPRLPHCASLNALFQSLLVLDNMEAICSHRWLLTVYWADSSYAVASDRHSMP